ncbi:MAG TPA: cytochrome c [Candidatus Eisenbacteria bacterium]|nr:cytochrome c [Candidatus Eisenbacteria bacterium]
MSARRVRVVAGALAPLLLGGCDNMRHQARIHPESPPARVAGVTAARVPPAGTVPAGPAQDPAFTTGASNGAPVARLPTPVTAALLARGRERFDITCAPCHGRVGDGLGAVVQRGFPRPPSLLAPPVLGQSAGMVFDHITHGFGIMPRFGPMVPPADRWAIVAYVRALQLAAAVPVARLDSSDRARLAGAR